MSHWNDNAGGRHRRPDTEKLLASDYVPSHAVPRGASGQRYGAAPRPDRAQPRPGSHGGTSRTAAAHHAHASPRYPAPAYAQVGNERTRLYALLVILGVAVVGASIVAIAVSLSGSSAGGYRPAAALARQLGCSGVHASTPAPGEVTIDLGIHPREEVLCTLDGRTIDITTWANARDQTAAEALGRSQLRSFREQAYIARGPGWLAGIDDATGATQLAVQKRVAQTIAGRLHGTVQHWH